jgi:hypothetical protein
MPSEGAPGAGLSNGFDYYIRTPERNCPTHMIGGVTGVGGVSGVVSHEGSFYTYVRTRVWVTKS